MKKFTRRLLLGVYRTGLKIFRGKGLHKIWPLGAIRDWLSASLRGGKPEKVVFRGQVIYLDPNDNLELSIWGDEDHPIVSELKVIENNVAPGDVAVDVGANIGLVTLFLAKAVGQGGKVFAFEPEPRNAAILRKNLAVNNHKNVEVVEKAVGEKSGKLKLFLSDFNVGDHRIYDPAEVLPYMPSGQVYEKLAHAGRRESIEVEAVPLDDFSRETGKRINFVKIDVQGAEGGVIRGMRNLLKTDIKILMEFWPAGMHMFGVPAEEVLGILEGYGFSFYDLRGGDLSPISARELLESYTVANNKGTNLLIKRAAHVFGGSTISSAVRKY